jgi:hypothetical protein
MTVNSTVRTAGPYVGTGSTGPYTFSFEVFQQSDVLVQVVSPTGTTSDLTLGTDYSVALNADQTNSPGGTVTLVNALVSGDDLVITSAIPITQGTSIPNNGGFYPKIIEQAFDKVTIIAQQIAETADRALVLPPNSTASPMLPSAAPSQVLAWDLTGTKIVNLDPSSLASIIALASVPKSDLWLDAQSGVDKTGATDSTMAFNNAVAAAALIGARLRVGGGTFLIRNGQINSPVEIECSGRYGTTFFTDSTTDPVLTINTTGEVEIRSVCIRGSQSATAGSLVKLNGGSSSGNAFSCFRDVLFQYGYTSIDTTSSYAWVVDRCYFTGFVQYGIDVNNTVNADAGDSTIAFSVFAGATGATAACINHRASGGLKIIGNKLNTGQYGYKMQLQGATSDLMIVGNSIENATAAAMGFFWTSGSFNNIVISGNQIALCPSGILMNDTHSFFSVAALNGNTITGITQYGIVIDNASDVAVGGNTIIGSSGIAGLTLGTSCSNPAIGVNKIRGFTTLIQNNSTAGAVTGFSRPLMAKTSGSDTGNTTAETVFATAYLPPLAMGLNGMLKMLLNWTATNNANSKMMRVRLGGLSGTVIWSFDAASHALGHHQIVCGNANNQASQVTDSTNIVDNVSSTVAAAGSAVDTTVAQQVVFTIQKAAGTDTFIPRHTLIELLA